MFNNSWFKKEKPLPSFAGFGGGIGGFAAKSGAAAGPVHSSSGGIIAEYNDPTTGGKWRAHIFVNDGTYTVNTAPSPGNIQLFMLGGGGGGSSGFASYGPGAGGGAGGWVRVGSDNGSGGITVTAADYAVTVGQGGAGGVSLTPNGSAYTSGNDGGPSTFVWSPTATITALGGGGGGCGPTNNWTQNTVGSGGGGGYGPGPTNGPQPGSQPTQNPGIPDILQAGTPGGSGDSSTAAGAGAGGASEGAGAGAGLQAGIRQRYGGGKSGRHDHMGRTEFQGRC